MTAAERDMPARRNTRGQHPPSCRLSQSASAPVRLAGRWRARSLLLQAASRLREVSALQGEVGTKPKLTSAEETAAERRTGGS